MPTVLWWGRFDPDYARNRILRKLLAELGWRVTDFHPRFSPLGDWEARLRGLPRPDLVWAPCFRQRDLAAAHRWARCQGVPLLFDPLISAYDKQVDERGKLAADSSGARRLLDWERHLFRLPDCVLADTLAHRDYFVEVLGVPQDKIMVVFVGAESALFTQGPRISKPAGEPLEILFFGSFIPLQGPQTVVEAARIYHGPPAKWTLIGRGPMLQQCKRLAAGLDNVGFEDWVPYEYLPERIRKADILLGVFGTTPKAARVIPNKVYQALACGRAVITQPSPAYPGEMRQMADGGLIWSAAGDAASLAARVAALASDQADLDRRAEAAAQTSARYFSEQVVRRQLQAGLALALNGRR